MVRETRHLWVGNLPENIREDRIFDHFKRYGKVQSVKILAKSGAKSDDNGPVVGLPVNGVSATVAFIDLKSAAKAHNSENKIEERTLKTDYYEPPASSTALSAIYIHEREDAHPLVQKPGVQTNVYSNSSANSRPAGRHTPNTRLSDERLYDRESRGLANYERLVDSRDSPYIKRNIGYLDDNDYQNRSRSRDRPFSRTVNNNSYGDQLDNRSQSHFRSYSRTSSQTHFDGQRYPSTEQLLEEPNVNSNTSTTTISAQRTASSVGGASNRRLTVSTTASGGVSSTVSSPPLKKKKKKKSLRSHSASPSPSRSSSLSSARSRSPSTDSNISTSSANSRSPSPAKSQSSLSQLYSGRKDRSSSSSVLISAATTTNNISTSSQGSNHTPLHNSGATPGSDSSADKDDTRPVAICVKNLPVRSTDSSLKDGLFHEYKKHGKVTMVKVVGQGIDRFAVVCFKKPEDVDKALVESKDKLFFGCKIEVSAHEGIDAEDNDFRPLEAELDEHHPKATRTLFVGNLEKDVSTGELKSHFDQFGEIIEIDIKKQGNLSSYAFIQFADISSVVKAMRKLDGENLGQNRIKLGFGKSMPTNCVWLHGVAEALTDKSLLWQANRFGTVTSLVVDRERCNALITYESVESAQIAVQDLKGRVLSGRKLQVDFASRECQTAFYDYLELTNQLSAQDRPYQEVRSGRQTSNNSANNWQEFDERIPNYDTHQTNRTSVGHNRYQRVNRSYTRSQSPIPQYGRQTQTGYGGRGRSAYQRFAQPQPSDTYSDDFERRHRSYDLEDYDETEEGFREDERDGYSRDRCETLSKAYSPVRSESPSPKERRDTRSTSPYSKSDICIGRDRSEERHSSKDKCSSRRPSEDLHDDWKPSASESLDRRRPKHKSCDSELIGHSPPASVRRLSHSKSPLPKDKAPALVNMKGQNTPQSPTASPCSSSLASPLRTECMDVDTDKDFEPSCGSSNVWRRKSMSNDDSQLELTGTHSHRLRSDSVSDSSDNGFVTKESLKRKRVDSDSPDTPTSSEAIGHLERKKRLLACLSSNESLHKERLGSASSGQSVVSNKNGGEHQARRELDALALNPDKVLKNELAKLLKRRNSSSGGATSDIKSKGHVISLIEQCIFGTNSDGQHSSDAVTHHPIGDALDSKSRSKHNINISTKPAKCSYGAKETATGLGVSALRTVDATSSVVNHAWPDPRRQPAIICSAQLCSSHMTNCKQIHRKLERSDAIYEMSCDSDVAIVSRVSSSDLECADRTLLKQDVVHTTTPKLEDHCSSEVSSSSDKVANALNNKSHSVPISLPLPEFAITTRAGGPVKVQSIPVAQPSQVSPKSTTIMSPLGQMSPNSVVPKVKARPSVDRPETSLAGVPPITKEVPCLVSTTDKSDSNATLLSDNKTLNVSTSSTKDAKSEEPFDEVSDPEMSPIRSPCFEKQIKALDEKYNAWSGANTNQTLAKVEKTPAPTIDYSKYNIKKKSQISATSSTDSQASEPSDIVKNLLSKSSIFDQDSKRLELINEKYEPKDLVAVGFDALTSPTPKPVFRTKAAAKEFSTPSGALPTDKEHSMTPKSSSLSHHTPHSLSLHSTSTHHPSLHHSSSHPIPGSLARKMSEPIRMPSAKKEPQTPTTPLTPTPASAPARTTSNPFSPFGRSSSYSNSGQTSPAAATRLPQSNLLSGIKKESSLPAGPLAKDAAKQCANRDPRENRDPRMVAKKENTLQNSIIPNTNALKDPSSIKKEINPVKSEFQKKASQLQQHSSSLPPHLASSGFSSKAQSFPTTSPVSSRQDSSNKPLLANKKHSTSESIETTESESWSRLTTDSKDKSVKTEKLKHNSQSGSQSKDNSDVQKTKSVDKKSSDVNKNADKNKMQSNVFNKISKEEKKLFKNKDNKQLSKTESKDKDKDKESKDKEKDKTKSKPDEKKSEKSKNSDNAKESKTPRSDKEKKEKKEKSKDKSKDTKLKASEIRMLLSIPDPDEPIYFSMYDKVKARSSANQNLKVAKDMECVRQKFSQLKDKRQKHDDKTRTSQDTDSDSDDSLSERIVNKHKKSSMQKKRKTIFETSSDSSSDDEEVNRAQQKNKKKLSVSKELSDSDSDVIRSKPVQKTKKQHKEAIYTSDSSMEALSTISSPKLTNSSPKLSTSSSSKTKKQPKHKSTDDSSDDEGSQKQMKKKKELKKKVKKDKSKEQILTKEPVKSDKSSEKSLDKSLDKLFDKSLDKSSDKSVDKSLDKSFDKSETKHSAETKVPEKTSEKVKKKLSKDKESSSLSKEPKKRKESSGTDNENESKQQKLAKRKKKKAKNSKLSKEKRHSSASRDRTSSVASDDKPIKHMSESSSSGKQSNIAHSDHEMRSSGMSDLEECLKREYLDIKSDESDSQTRTHVIKCYNKESKHSEARGVVSHTEWEKSETCKPSVDKLQNKTLAKPCPQSSTKSDKIDKTDKIDLKPGNKSPKKLAKEQVIQEISSKNKKEIKPQKDDKQAIKEEMKRKKMKKQIKNKEKEKEKDKERKDRTEKPDKEGKDKEKERTHDKSKDKEKERLVKDDKETKKVKVKEEPFNRMSQSPPPKTPDLLKSSLSPSYNDLLITNDSSSSDSKVDEDLLKNARMLEECMMAGEASEDSSCSTDDLIMPSGNHAPKSLTPIPITNLIKPSKEEQKQQQRRYEEEAAIQSLRLQKELMEERDERPELLIKDMKRPFQDLGFETEIVAHQTTADMAIVKSKPSIDESLFSISSSSHKDVFEPSIDSNEKCEDTKESEMDDQRKMEDDLAVAALLQDMNDPIGVPSTQEAEEYKDYKEPEGYEPAPSDQIDEMSYMGMLGEEEPPLQIAESPPEAIIDETSAALKSISENFSQKSPLIEKIEEVSKDNDLKPETIVHPIDEIKRESNDWQTTSDITVNSDDNSVFESIQPDINAVESELKSPEIKTNESIETFDEKPAPIVDHPFIKEEPKETKESENNSQPIDEKPEDKAKDIKDSDTNLVDTFAKEEQLEQKPIVTEEHEIKLTPLLSPAPLLPSSVPEDKLPDTCSDGGVSERTEIFEDEVESEPQLASEPESHPTEIDVKPEETKPKIELEIPPITPLLTSPTVDIKPLITPLPERPFVIEDREESESDDKKTIDRPRRGRRAKTRKFSESSLQLPRYETGCVSLSNSYPGATAPPGVSAPAVTSTPLKRGPKSVSDRPVRRSGRTSGLDTTGDEHHADNEHSGDEHPLKIDEPVAHEEEPKKVNKRGRKKKVSGTFGPENIKPVEEPQKKERILLSLPVHTDKGLSDTRKTNSPYDVFEFRDSDEEETLPKPLESIHKQTTDTKAQQIISHPVPEVVDTSAVIKIKHEETPVIKASTAPAVDTHHTHVHQEPSKEYVSEVSQHGKLSITIRLHPKDGQDGGATSTAEVVKTSKALYSDDSDTKQTIPKAPIEQPAPTPETQNKGVRKSSRLAKIAEKSTVEETIENVIKHSNKDDSKSKRITRSNRKSEESVDAEDEHNDDSKNVLLRSYRITRSSTRGSITSDADNSQDNTQTQTPVAQEAHEPVVPRRSAVQPPLPVLKVELPKITAKIALDQKKVAQEVAIEAPVEVKPIAGPIPPKESANDVPEPQEDSRSSPAVLLDPVTGLLEPVQKKAFEHTAVIQAVKQPVAAACPSTSSGPVASQSSATGVVCQSPAVTAVSNTITTNATTSVITPANHSVITSTAIQDIPNISERIHGSTIAVKLKTGKPFSLPEVDKPVLITSSETTPTTPASIAPVTPTTPASIKPSVQTSAECTIAPPTVTTTQSQPITITPKYPPPVGQPLVQPIAQPMPGQWPQSMATTVALTQPTQSNIQSRLYPPIVSTPHSVVTSRPTIPTLPKKIEMSQAQSVPQPPPAHQKLTLEPKVPPSMPTSVVTSHSSTEQMLSPPAHKQHESRRDSISSKPSSKYGSGLQIAGFPTPAHDSAAAHISLASNMSSSNRSVIEEVLQNPHLLPQQKQEILANLSREQQREQLSRERSITPASIHEQSVRGTTQTPTPEGQNPLIPPHMTGLHMRPPSQSALIHPHALSGLHPTEMQALEQMRLEMIAAQYQQEMRVRQEAQGLVRAAMNMPPRFVYPTGQYPMPLTAETKTHELTHKERERAERERQHQEERALREKAKHEKSGRESVGRLSHQEEVELKSSIQRQAEAELKRQAESHDRLLSSMQPPPPLAPIRIPPGVPYPSPMALRQFAPHLLSPHERYTDSPAMVYSQGRPQMRAEELKQQESLRRSPIVKMDESRKYQSPADFSQLHRQQLTSHSPQYGLDSRSMQPPSHSPGAMSYRKETTRSPMPSEEAMRKQLMANQYPQSKDMNSSPGPMALNMSSQQMSGGHVQMSHNQHEGLMRRAAMHPIPQLGSEPPIHGPPPPAHAISQAGHHQALTQTPQHASQVPTHGDALLQRYPVMWQGLFALKNDQAAVQMHYVSGNINIARNSLPPITEGGVSPLRIAQRMRLEPQQLTPLARKIQSIDEHCILLALPCGRDHMDVLQQSNNLKTGFITYLQSKQAAGIVNMNAPGSNQAAYVIHIFPTCEFSHENLVRIAPDLLHSLQEISHLLVVIATV